MRHRILPLLLALFLLLPGCRLDKRLTREELGEKLAAALDWDWISNPYRLAVDVGLVDPDQKRFTDEETAEILSALEARQEAKVDWLHGFYAMGAFEQIGLTRDMDAASLCWAQLYCGGETGPVLDDKTGSWSVPEGADRATGYLEEGGTPYHLCVYCGDVKEAVSPQNRGKTVELLVEAAQGYQGLTVDFEGLKGAQYREDFTAFVRELRQKLPEGEPLYIAVPPADWYAGYDFKALGELCDKVILMAHDYNWTYVPPDYIGTKSTDTPVAPLDQVYRALCQITDPETGVQDKSKIALALSFGTCGVKVDGEENLVGDKLYHPTSRRVSERLAQPDSVVNWSDQFQTPYLLYTDEGGDHYKLWYEDADSVAAKIRLARLFGVGGLSLWRLGLVPDFENYNVWDVILKEAGR